MSLASFPVRYQYTALVSSFPGNETCRGLYRVQLVPLDVGVISDGVPFLVAVMCEAVGASS